MLIARTKVYSISEFLNQEEINELNKIDKFIGHLKRNKKVYKKLVFTVAMTMLFVQFDIRLIYAVNVDEAINKINDITKQLLRLVQVVGSSANLILVFKNVITELFRGSGNISKPVMNFIWIQLVLYFLPMLGDLIASIAE